MNTPPPLASDRIYFLKTRDGEKGPFSLEELRGKLGAGEITRDQSCRIEGKNDWKSIESWVSKAPSLDHGVDDAFNMHEDSEPIIEEAVKTAITDFKTLDYSFLIPLKKILSFQLLRKKAVRWVLLFGVAPLAMWEASSILKLSFQQTVWMIALYFCSFWSLYFYGLIRPSPTVWRRALGYALFTAFVGIPIVLYSQRWPVIRQLYAMTESTHFWSRTVGYIFGVGLLEELCKASPLIIFGLRKKTLQTTRDGLFLGFMSGLGFAAVEGVKYTVTATATAAYYGEAAGYTSQLLQVVFRMMTGPILHGAWAGIVGWFIGVAAMRKAKEWPTITVGVLLMATLHGLNDVMAGGWLHIAIAAFSVIVFMAYFNHEEEKRS